MSMKTFHGSFQIPDQENARKAKPGDPFTFTVDASKTGWGEVAIDVVFENRSIRRTFYVEEVGNRIYQVGTYSYYPVEYLFIWQPDNGTAHFKKSKQLFEYQHLLLLRDIWWLKF